MTKFEIQRYTLTVEALKVCAENQMEAITKCQQNSDDVLFITEEVIERDNSQGICAEDHNSSEWKRLFEEYATYTGTSQSSLPSFRAIKNCETNESWDRYLGYIRGAVPPKVDPAENDLPIHHANNVKPETLQLFGISPNERIEIMQCNECKGWFDWSRWREVIRQGTCLTRVTGLKCPGCGTFHDPAEGSVAFTWFES